MGKQNLKLTPQGHRVMGALSAFIAPRLASDQSLQSIELEAVCKSISPGRYDKQIEGIIGTVNERFGSRLASDQKLDDLRKVLLALMPLDLAHDKRMEEEAEDSDDDSNDDSNDALPPFLKAKIKAKDKKEEDDSEEEDTEEEDDSDAEDKAACAAKDKAAKDKAANKNANDPDLKNKIVDMSDSEEEQWVKNHKEGTTDKKAKDSAHDSQIVSDGADLALRRLQARYEAAEIVKPIVGKVNVFACDSAAAIYKMALDVKGIDTTEIPRSSFGAVLRAVLKTESNKPKARFAQDTAITKSLLDEFPNLPGIA